jgi:hypothetical protein
MFAFAFLRNIFEHEGQFYNLRNPLSSNKIIRGSRQQNVAWIGASEIIQKMCFLLSCPSLYQLGRI